MSKIKKIIETQKDKFDKNLNDYGISSCSSVRLIPNKTGDEMALTSIILSSFRLIKEFRHEILFSDIKLKKGNIFCYKEVSFLDNRAPENSRIDGLILVTNRSGKIIDAVFFEMKSGKENVKKDQIEKYIEIAKKCGIEKIVTVSNEFVQEPDQTPLLNIKVPKNIKLYHLSWTYIRTIASLLLFKNDNNIDDPDQVEIMKEVATYLDNDKGICDFSQMKTGWKETLNLIKHDITLKKSDQNFQEAILSWLQEEKDMALKLSCDLGVLVKLNKKLKSARDHHITTLKENHILGSSLSVKNTVSDILITANLKAKTVSMSIKTNVEPLKTIKGRLSWIKKQIDNALTKIDVSKNDSLKENLNIEVIANRLRIKKPFKNFDQLYDSHKLQNKEIKGFCISLTKELHFNNVKVFVIEIEEMLIDFYKSIVQNIKNSTPEPPKSKGESNS